MEENGNSMGGNPLEAASGLAEHSFEIHIPERFYIAGTLVQTQRYPSVLNVTL
jgi:hypothetical protein